jgi:hypothetical protein
MYETIKRNGRDELVYRTRSAATSWCLYFALLSSLGGGAYAGCHALSAKLPDIAAAITEFGKAGADHRPAVVASR